MAATLVLRTVKGTPLTNLEVDNNFSNISTYANTIDANIGLLASLTTTSTSNIVAAVNSVKSDQGNISLLTTTSTSNIVSAVNSVKSGNLSQFGSTTSAQLLSIISDETGTGSLVFATSPTLTTPNLGIPASGNLISCTADGTNPVGYKNLPASSSITTTYNPVVGDVGKILILGSGGTITLTASVFSAGDAFSIFNNTSSTITCNVQAVTTVYKSGIDTDVNTFDITTRGIATIVFITSSVALVSGSIT
jgi:hypothetical protein